MRATGGAPKRPINPEWATTEPAFSAERLAPLPAAERREASRQRPALRRAWPQVSLQALPPVARHARPALPAAAVARAATLARASGRRDRSLTAPTMAEAC